MFFLGCIIILLGSGVARAQVDSLGAELLELDKMLRKEMVHHVTSAFERLVHSETGELPEKFVLDAAYPNPFREETRIGFSLPKRVDVRLEVYDVLGRRVLVLVDRKLPAGRYQVVFRPEGLASGLYFYRLKAGDFTQHRELIYVR